MTSSEHDALSAGDGVRMARRDGWVAASLRRLEWSNLHVWRCEHQTETPLPLRCKRASQSRICTRRCARSTVRQSASRRALDALDALVARVRARAICARALESEFAEFSKVPYYRILKSSILIPESFIFLNSQAVLREAVRAFPVVQARPDGPGTRGHSLIW